MAKTLSVVILLCAGASLYGCVMEDDYGRYPQYEGDHGYYCEHGRRHDDERERMEREERREHD